MVIALTGGICCGKSTVLNIIKKLGYEVYDVDKIAHDLLKNEEIKNKIKNQISKTVFQKDLINRDALSKIVFSDKEKLKILNSILHPKIIDKMIQIINEAKQNNKTIIIEVPLLYELHLEKYFDASILVYVDKKTQLNRIISRDKKTKIQAINILNSQMDIELKKSLTNYIIENYNIDCLYENIKKVLERVKNGDK